MPPMPRHASLSLTALHRLAIRQEAAIRRLEVHRSALEAEVRELDDAIRNLKGEKRRGRPPGRKNRRKT